jgi:hypothetical protein
VSKGGEKKRVGGKSVKKEKEKEKKSKIEIRAPPFYEFLLVFLVVFQIPTMEIK